MTAQEYINEAKRTPYQEGEHDCATFVAKWVDLKLGTHYCDELTGYKSILQGMRKFAPKGVAQKVEEELRALGVKCGDRPKAGAVAILENGYAAVVGEDGFCATPLAVLTGITLIHYKHAKSFYYV